MTGIEQFALSDSWYSIRSSAFQKDLLQYQELWGEKEETYPDDFGTIGGHESAVEMASVFEAMVGAVNYCLEIFCVVDGLLLVFGYRCCFARG